MRRLIASIALVGLAVTACGDDEPTTETSGPLDDVTVVEEEGEAPTLEFEQPFEVTESSRKVLEEGDGEVVADGAVLSVDFLMVNGEDGSEIQSTYGSDPGQFVFDDKLMQGVYDGLADLPEGSRVLVAIAPEDGFGTNPDTGEEATETILLLADVVDVTMPLERAEGTAVEPVPGLPTVELAEDGAPTITVPDTEPPTELVVQPLIEGEGPEVETGQSITVHYTGVVWGGEQFDSSWERGTPATFQIGTGSVIPGWDEGLVGQTVGSQVLLVIPSEKGYPEGSPDGSIKAGDTIVFVVDILAAS